MDGIVTVLDASSGVQVKILNKIRKNGSSIIYFFIYKILNKLTNKGSTKLKLSQKIKLNVILQNGH